MSPTQNHSSDLWDTNEVFMFFAMKLTCPAISSVEWILQVTWPYGMKVIFIIYSELMSVTVDTIVNNHSMNAISWKESISLLSISKQRKKKLIETRFMIQISFCELCTAQNQNRCSSWECYPALKWSKWEIFCNLKAFFHQPIKSCLVRISHKKETDGWNELS